MMGEAVQSRESQQPDPLVVVNDPHKIAVEAEQPLFERLAAIGNPARPGRIPEFREPLIVDSLDQHVLAWEIPIDQRLRDAETARQFAGLATKPLLGKEAQRVVNDQSLAIRRRHADAKDARSRAG